MGKDGLVVGGGGDGNGDDGAKKNKTNESPHVLPTGEKNKINNKQYALESSVSLPFLFWWFF
jgi:hypothetical protein